MATLHPDFDLLTEYAAGSLPLAQSACLSIHVKQCDHCKRITGQFNALGAALLESLEPLPVGDAQLNAVLARLDEEQRFGHTRHFAAPDAR